MTRLIFVGDQHLDTVAPSSRKDNYFESMKAKFNEIKRKAIALKVQGIVLSGDLIHKQDGHRVPYLLINWLIEFCKDCSITLYVAMGNHDIRSVSANWHRQPIGALVSAGVITPLWQTPTQDNPTGGRYVRVNDEVVLHGKMFDYDADTAANRPKYYSMEKQPGAFNIMVCHSALIPDNTTFFGHWTNPAELATVVKEEKAADLYLCGHIHEDLGSYGSFHIKAFNPGALSRGSIDEFNLKRRVQVGLIEIEWMGTEFRCAISTIPLECALPAEEVFYVKELAKKKQRSQELENLADLLKAGTMSSEFALVNPEEALEIVLKSKNVNKKVEKIVRDYVASARQELS